MVEISRGNYEHLYFPASLFILTYMILFDMYILKYYGTCPNNHGSALGGVICTTQFTMTSSMHVVVHLCVFLCGEFVICISVYAVCVCVYLAGA